MVNTIVKKQQGIRPRLYVLNTSTLNASVKLKTDKTSDRIRPSTFFKSLEDSLEVWK